ncbi:hypothetical protein D0Z08_31075 [Nocardioides immobilis]|uniref:Uncharacterized protein n=2 Tax=Nocardioides immobilis TaxID=2049295 RepID=A0A417XSF5_9ACTN|nr:hypothetical protein D0Z08_31075 [Nocardioides immobilis]
MPRALMVFHRDWHEAQEGRGTRFFEEAAEELSLERLLRVVAALTVVPKISARPAFVAGLRERLIAEAVTQSSGQQTALHRGERSALDHSGRD